MPSLRALSSHRILLSVTLALAIALAGSIVVSAAGGGRPSSDPYEDASLPVATRVADLLSRMTLKEKVGQMTMAERADVTDTPSIITTMALGALLSGGGSAPSNNTPAGWAAMVDGFQREALKTRLHIPLLYGIDAVHGDNNVLGSTVFPHNIGLGATRDPALVQQVEHITATETRASGPNWVFAPCICVARDDRWGRTYESFGEVPALVEQMEAAAIKGFQGSTIGALSQPDHLLATAKHFAGDGLTSYDASKADTGAYPIDQGVDHVSREEFARLALAPYKTAVEKDHVGSVMVSFSSVDFTDGHGPGSGGPVKMSADKQLITGVLKHSYQFHGIVVSDWRAIHQLPGDFQQAVATAVNAGIDMFMEPAAAPGLDYIDFESALIGLVHDHAVTMSRIDDAVSRILRAKFQLGLFEHPFTPRGLQKSVGDAAHHAVARRAAAESQVLLENANATLPLTGDQPVYVAGDAADHMGYLAGGWTVTWQGGVTISIPGTTILDGVRQDASGPVTYSSDGSTPVPSGAAAIVVVGETPYAEGYGDVGGPLYSGDLADNGTMRPPKTMSLAADQDALITSVCAQAASCTVLVVSGRPLAIPSDVLSHVDALVASWLPGSEGAGVADDLFGKHAFTGKLPVSWPRTATQEPINVGDPGYDPLYPFGYGLTTEAVG